MSVIPRTGKTWMKAIEDWLVSKFEALVIDEGAVPFGAPDGELATDPSLMFDPEAGLLSVPGLFISENGLEIGDFSVNEQGVASGALAYGGTSQSVGFSSTPTFDASLGEFVFINITGNISPVMPNGLAGQRFTVAVQQGTGGSHLVTWPASVRLAGGALTLTTTVNKVDLITFVFDDVNGKWREISRALNQSL